MEPKIVVAGMWPRDRKAPRFPLSYVTAVKKAGGSPEVMSAFPLTPGESPPENIEVTVDVDPDDVRLPDDASGLLLPGGGDVDPADYGQEPHPRTYNVSRKRDHFEYALLDQALERDLPVLAICRGMQVLNVHLGGSLEQNLADRAGRLDHDRDMPRAEPAHGYRAERDSLVAKAIENSDTGINSHHHQGLDEVPEPLLVTGWADDGVIESVESKDHSWVVGVQWHPEAMAPINAEELKLFQTFVKAAVAYGPAARSDARTA